MAHLTAVARPAWKRERHAQTTRALYDQAARTDTGRTRDAGAAIALKDFHNQVKAALYDEFARDAGHLLDLGCGRGGDLWKWAHAGVQRVHAIDASPDSVAAARERYAVMEARCEWICALRANFVCDGTFGLCAARFAQPFDAVSCMFALHYFFASEAELLRTLDNVARNLKPGGAFFGCVPRGTHVLELLRRGSVALPRRALGPQATVYETACLRLEADAVVVADPPCFGGAYRCAMSDTVVEAGSTEFLVFENVLTAAARAAGLEPVRAFSLGLGALVEEAADTGGGGSGGGAGVFRQFKPRYPGEPALEEASRLVCVFAFRKATTN